MRCCSPRGLQKVFGERTARRDVARYRRKGLRASERAIVGALRGRVRSILEIGGGAGAIEVELLEAGAERATNAELAPAWEPVARELAREHGVEERVEFRLANIAEEHLGHADAVVMHRVVCCYPDGELLVRRGAEHAERLLALTFPREAWWTRAGVRVVNAGMWLSRADFRVYVHPVARLVAAADGMRVTSETRDLVWQTVILERQKA